jgi:hypothetical protein
MPDHSNAPVNSGWRIPRCLKTSLSAFQTKRVEHLTTTSMPIKSQQILEHANTPGKLANIICK